MDFRWGTMMSLRTVMKPHMKNSVVTIVNAREFVFVPVAGASVSDLADIRFLTGDSRQRCDPRERSGIVVPLVLLSQSAYRSSHPTRDCTQQFSDRHDALWTYI